mgnify:CR=1 FL=1
MAQPQSGYEQAAVYWRNKYEYERARREELEERIRNLHHIHRDPAGRLAESFRMQPGAAKVLSILLEHSPSPMAKSVLFDWMPKNRDGRDLKLVDVYICKVREALRKNGIEHAVTTVWGYGYGVSSEGRAAIYAHMDAHYGEAEAAA